MRKKGTRGAKLGLDKSLLTALAGSLSTFLGSKRKNLKLMKKVLDDQADYYLEIYFSEDYTVGYSQNNLQLNLSTRAIFKIKWTKIKIVLLERLIFQ